MTPDIRRALATAADWMRDSLDPRLQFERRYNADAALRHELAGQNLRVLLGKLLAEPARDARFYRPDPAPVNLEIR